jgi:hypothetical protein
MRILFIIGLLLLLVGIASLFVPIPHHERHGVQVGPVSLGVDTVDRERVHPGVSAVIIVGGVVLMIAGGRKRK